MATSGPGGDGEVSYDRPPLATGASPRRLTFPGSDREEVLYLRTVGDSGLVLRSAFQRGTRVVVAGAGGSGWRPRRPPGRLTAR